MTKELAIRVLTGDVLGTTEQTQEAITMAVKALSQPGVTAINVRDTISRQAAIDALWKALYEYEDKTEKQFLESEELNTDDWFQHRIFVQNMSGIDIQTILNLPSAQRWIPCSERLPKEEKNEYWICTDTEYQCSCRWTNDNLFWHGETSDWHWNIFDIPQYSKVVAWMPLPGAYKGEKNG